MPAGTVQFYAGDSPLGSPVTLNGGTASITVPASASETTISAAYTSDSISWPDSMSGLLVIDN